ncbi:MAG: phosphoadenylyl-sulfate reductase [Myxococcota bacterium]
MQIAESLRPASDRERLEAVAHDLAGRLDPGDKPARNLAAALDAVGGRVTLGTAFGREGCVLVHLVATHQLAVDLFTLDTGLFFEETYALWEALETRYGVEIRRIEPRESIDDQAARLGPALWERQPNRCCHLRKVVPLRGVLAEFDGWVTGVRRGQSAVRAQAQISAYDTEHNVVKINPLVAWSDEKLNAFIETHQIPINALHARGYPSIGCWPCTSPVAPGEDPRAGRWRGQSKTECGIHASFAARERLAT